MTAKKYETPKQNYFIKCFGLLLFMFLPVVGVVITIVLLLTAKKSSFVGTLSRAVLLVHLCLTVILVSLFFATGAFLNSLKNEYPHLKNGYIYAKEFLKSGVGGVVDRMSETGELDKVLAKIDVKKLLLEADLSELLGRIETKDLLEVIDTEAIIKHFGIDDVVSKIDQKKLLSMIEADKLMNYIDINALIQKINEKELQEILENRKDK